MCPPEHFAVDYVINPWMNPDRAGRPGPRHEPVGAAVRGLSGLGHTVHFIDPEPGLPDMVFAANGGTVIGGRVLGARFRYPSGPRRDGLPRLVPAQRLPDVREPRTVNEGEGDILYAGTAIIAGHGFRSDPEATSELDGALRPAGDQRAAG